TYAWDFCDSDLSVLPSASLESTISASNFLGNIEVVQSSTGAWYGFGVSRDNSKIYRLSYGGSLMFSSGTAEELVISGSNVVSPYDIEVVNQGGNWYGFVANSGGTLTKLSFGSSLSNLNVTGTSYSGLGLSTPRYLEVEQEGGNYYAVVSNFGSSKLTIINLGSDLATITPSVQDVTITGGSGLLGLSVEKEGSTWYGLVASFSNSKVYRVDFGSVLNDAVTADKVVDISSKISGLDKPTDVSILGSTGVVFLQQNIATGLKRLVFGSGLGGDPVVTTVSGTPAGYSNIFGIDFAFQGTDWVGFGANFSSKSVYRVIFPKKCEVDLGSVDITSAEPGGVKYVSSGTKYVRLTGTHSGGSKASLLKSLEVSSGTSPDIDFSYTG
ncbi:MAG: hypothetical protein RLP14_00005, partial [Owenweeksia sp.]